MLTFTNKLNLLAKSRVLHQLRTHRLHGEIVQGGETSWDEENNRGDAIGCTTHYWSADFFETFFGIPRELAKIENFLFDNMAEPEAVLWPEQFIQAIPERAALSKIPMEMAIDEFNSLGSKIITDRCTDAQIAVITRIQSLCALKCQDSKLWREAEKAAEALMGTFIPVPENADNQTYADIWSKEAGRHACFAAKVMAGAAGARPDVVADWMDPETLLPWLEQHGIDRKDEQLVAQRLHRNGNIASNLRGVAIVSMLRSYAFAVGYAHEAASAEIAALPVAADLAQVEQFGDAAERRLCKRIADDLAMRLSKAPVLAATA